jgi:hypothetical protein
MYCKQLVYLFGSFVMFHMYAREDNNDVHSCSFIEIPNIAWKSYASSYAARSAIRRQGHVTMSLAITCLQSKYIARSINTHVIISRLKCNKKKHLSPPPPLASGKFSVI